LELHIRLLWVAVGRQEYIALVLLEMEAIQFLVQLLLTAVVVVVLQMDLLLLLAVVGGAALEQQLRLLRQEIPP
jgi:hypothetical protein